MKYPSNLRKQIVLMSDCARFLISNERVMPSEIQDNNTLQVTWRKKEQKKLERFAKHFDPKFFANSVSVFSRPKRRREINIVTIMQAFSAAVDEIQQLSSDNLSVFRCRKTYYDKELDFIAHEAESLLIEIAEKARELELKKFALSLIFDQKVLYDFSMRRNRVLAKMAKDRMAYLKQIYEGSPQD